MVDVHPDVVIVVAACLALVVQVVAVHLGRHSRLASMAGKSLDNHSGCYVNANYPSGNVLEKTVAMVELQPDCHDDLERWLENFVLRKDCHCGVGGRWGNLSKGDLERKPFLERVADGLERCEKSCDLPVDALEDVV